MTDITFVIGGCRSGKSRHALRLAESTPAVRRIFVATCVPRDDEMRSRVACHQGERSGEWETLEVPEGLGKAISDHSRPGVLLLIDCLTLWTSNLLLASDDPEGMEAPLDELISAVKSAAGPVILVSNEVGTGIVPENRLARLYRDMVGKVNQTVAACADRVILTVAGIPVTIKGDEWTA
jgi:adenosylcobinamide kinase/adenosylcobinamide-phosphate guanylyltransferase